MLLHTAYTVRISCISLWWCGRRKSLREQIENTAEGDETKTQRRGNKKKKKKKSQTGCWKSSQWALQQTGNVHSVREYQKSRVGAEQHTHFMSRADGQSLTNLLESLFNKKNPKYKNNNERKRERKKRMRKHIVSYLFYWLIIYCPNIMSVSSPHTRVNAYYIDWRCISYHHYTRSTEYSSFSFFFDSCLFVKLCSLFFSRIDPNCRDAADQSN